MLSQITAPNRNGNGSNGHTRAYTRLTAARPMDASERDHAWWLR